MKGRNRSELFKKSYASYEKYDDLVTVGINASQELYFSFRVKKQQKKIQLRVQLITKYPQLVQLIS